MAKQYFSPKPEEIHAGNIAELKKRIKEGNVSGSYVFYGDEDYTKNYYYDRLTEFCGNKALNIKTITGSQFNIEDFLNSCDIVSAQSLDMFSVDTESTATCRLVRLISPDFKSLNKKETSQLLSRIEDPDENVIIILWLTAGEKDRLSKGLIKNIADASLVLNFKREAVGSPALAAWIIKHFKGAGIEIPRNVAMYMCNYVGNDMTTLKNEIDSCVGYLKYEGRDTVTINDIEYICKKNSTAQIFDISDNALSGNYASAMIAFNTYIKSAKNPSVAATEVFAPIFKAVYDMCCVENGLKSGDTPAVLAKSLGLHEFVVKKYTNLLNLRSKNTKSNIPYTVYASRLCCEYDTKYKNSTSDNKELVKELIFKLCYDGAGSE